MSVIVDIFLCRTDNYGFLVHDIETRRTAAIDAPDAVAVKTALNRRGWTLTDILITHHHRDHVEGLPVLKADYEVTTVGPRAEAEKILGLDVVVEGGDGVPFGGTLFKVIETPGHTLGHVAYYNAVDGHVFVGDALFSMGCGRMMEGKPGPMWEGLKALRALPDDTLMYCGHEYTEANAKFAMSVDPRNAAITIRAAEVARMRADNRYTIPVSMGMEKRTNPFLRPDQPALADAMGLERDIDPSIVFAALRTAKDRSAEMVERLIFKPVTKASWPDFETLFESPGAPKYCWCMAFRSTPEEVPTPGPKRKPFIKARVDAGTPIGLVGALKGEPVAWVSIAPRDTYQRLGGPKAKDGEVIWSLACMYVARTHRKAGLSVQLIEAAGAYAQKRGATVLEAYPVTPDSPSYRFMGFVPAFERLGFHEVARSGKRRHIMRLPLNR